MATATQLDEKQDGGDAGDEVQLSLIGVRGAMGAGKDKLSELIRRIYPKMVVLKFAGVLRRALSIITTIPVERTYSDEDKARLLPTTLIAKEVMRERIRQAIIAVTGRSSADETHVDAFLEQLTTAFTADLVMLAPITIGTALQRLGTDCFRAIVGTDVFVRATIRTVPKTGAIITDVRFPNESEAVRRKGGVIVHVRRKAAERSDGRSTAHASERALDGEKADLIINNDGTIEDLAKAFEKAIPTLKMITSVRTGAMRALAYAKAHGSAMREELTGVAQAMEEMGDEWVASIMTEIRLQLARTGDASADE